MTIQQSNLDSEQVGHLIEMAKYHRDGLMDRRRTQLRSFTGLAIVDLLIVRWVTELLMTDKVSISNEGIIRILTCAALVLGVTLFIAYVVQIENRNAWSRKNYFAAEVEIHKILGLPDFETKSNQRHWTLAWATIWPCATALLLAVAGCIIVYLV